MHTVPLTDATDQVRLVAAVSTDVTDRELARAEQAQLASLTEQALVTVEPVDLWQRATTVLADQLGAAATFHEVDVPAGTVHNLKLAVGVGPPPPTGGAESVLSTVIRTGRVTARAPETSEGWWTLAAPVGRPGAYTAVVALHHPGPGAEPFSDRDGDRDEEFLGAVAGVLGSAAVRFATEREIRHRSTHDALTDLPNRSWLLGRLTRALEQHRTGVVFVDLDGFKTVNDTHGHRAGDQLLREIAHRLQAAVRPGDVVARLAGGRVRCALRAGRIACGRAAARPATPRGDQRTRSARGGDGTHLSERRGGDLPRRALRPRPPAQRLRRRHVRREASRSWAVRGLRVLDAPLTSDWHPTGGGHHRLDQRMAALTDFRNRAEPSRVGGDR
ncbi:diguanylate cyclase [Parafrankia sp. EUN1f]|nr:diguanylate cyclase [Parafrankia sp. EUN1f]